MIIGPIYSFSLFLMLLTPFSPQCSCYASCNSTPHTFQSCHCCCNLPERILRCTRHLQHQTIGTQAETLSQPGLPPPNTGRLCLSCSTVDLNPQPPPRTTVVGRYCTDAFEPYMLLTCSRFIITELSSR